MSSLSFDDKREMVYSDWSAGKITRVRADEMLRTIGEQEAQARRDTGTAQPALHGDGVTTLHDHYARNALACGHAETCEKVTAEVNWPTMFGRPSCTCGHDQRRGSRSAVAAPRCAVCGGPSPDGSGCEYCPAVTS